MTIVRTRTQGNFLFKIFEKSPIELQVKLKSELVKRNLWRSFNDAQTLDTKKKGFDSETIDLCVLILITDPKISTIYGKTGVEKLFMFWAEIMEKDNE